MAGRRWRRSIEVTEHLGLSVRALDHWVRIGIIRCHASGTGSGYRRRFDDASLRAVWAVKQFRDSGQLAHTDPYVRQRMASVARVAAEGHHEVIIVPVGGEAYGATLEEIPSITGPYSVLSLAGAPSTKEVPSW